MRILEDGILRQALIGSSCDSSVRLGEPATGPAKTRNATLQGVVSATIITFRAALVKRFAGQSQATYCYPLNAAMTPTDAILLQRHLGLRPPRHPCHIGRQHLSRL